MDFSNSERALTSLLRRQPPLPPEVHSLSNRLLPLHSDPLKDTPTFLECTLSLLRCGGTTAGGGGTNDSPSSSVASQRPRWEPLAVGLHLSLSFLEAYGRRVHGVGSNKVFMDGPRVPDMQPQSLDGGSTTTTTTTTTTNNDVQSIHEDEHTSHFSNELTTILSTHLEHSEPRVRTLVAKVSGEHTRVACAYLSSDPSSICGREILGRSLDLYRSIGVSLYEHLRVGREAALKLAMEAEEQQKKGNGGGDGDGDGRNVDTDADRRDEAKDPMEKVSKASGGALDDTTGWRALETNLYGVGSFVCASSHLYFRLAADASSASNVPVESKEEEEEQNEVGPDPKLIEAVKYCCITHINRHVRAAGINVLEQLIHASTTVDPSTSSTRACLITDSESALHTTIVEVLRVCLADNWSQVRMAASVLCRAFFVALLDHLPNDTNDGTNTVLQKIYVQLLPRMCLNRFYLAQGVKLYSHETWRILFDRPPIPQDGSSSSSLISEGTTATTTGGGGLEAVARCAGAVCRYYVKMCDADNHVVREAACQAVAELANKLGRNEEYKEYLAPFVPLLLQALLMCFHDESWPVRDEACLACGTFCLAYPSECEPELPTLFARWTEQLTDQIWSVREDAAVALGDAILAYGPTMLEKVLGIVRRDLPSAKDQPAMTMEEYRRRQNDIESHTDSQLYSCGSLAPKLRKGGAGRIGCSNCLINRPKAPWEATDGCIYLIRELCVRLCTGGSSVSCGSSVQYDGEAMALTDDVLFPLMEEMIDACRARHYPQSDDLRTTLWKQLPVMANALGKQRFKRTYLQLFLDLMMKDVDNLGRSSDAGGTSQLSAHAAGQCLGELGTLVGDGILRGRLEEEWQERAFDRVVEERGMRRGPAMAEDGFSPFGPSGSMVPSSSMGRTSIGGAMGGGQVFGGGGTGVRTGAGSHFGMPGTGLVDVL